ncbi:MAG TPA: FAD-dependent monooxygenase [Caulobacteraceae bacterium]|nr:FAD-dependent monooxygenase [Caulobacteraceae bacterium]
MAEPTPTDVLIAGAGPTGLVLALWLTAQGARVRIIDSAPGPGTTTRAVAVQARTLELYRQLDLAAAVLAAGHATIGVNLWARGRRAARLPLGRIGEGLTPYPQLHIYSQDAHERLLTQRLAAAGVEVERGLRLAAIEQRAASVLASVEGGSDASIEASFLVGCDGAHSVVRGAIGAQFAGGSYRHIFYVADIEATGPVADGELHVALETSDFLGVFPLDDGPRLRLVGTVRDERAARAESLEFADVSKIALEGLPLEVKQVNWFSTYRVHHRVADRFASGRVFLAGDAAHVHSPVGGQGMNTGIGDAINLAWKLAAVAAGRADQRLLDTYEPERIAFARQLVATTDRAFSLVTADSALAGFIRTWLAPGIMAFAVRFRTIQRLAFRTVSQTAIAYPRSALSLGAAGAIAAGQRLPWTGAAGGADNFLPLPRPGWQGHVYGEVPVAVTAWFAANHLTLREFSWRRSLRRLGLTRGALYLLRPDDHVGLADPSPTPQALDAYFARIGVRPREAAPGRSAPR